MQHARQCHFGGVFAGYKPSCSGSEYGLSSSAALLEVKAVLGDEAA